jgi:1-pyrroline-5-carboxylate dehydrogenase
MLTAVTTVPTPSNEPVMPYAPNSPERGDIQKAIEAIKNEQRQLVSVIDGVECAGSEIKPVVAPHQHGQTLAQLHSGGEKEVAQGIEAALRAKQQWSECSFDERAAVFLNAAELLAGPYRARMNAATMLGQSKTVHQAEIDAACELIDFWRYNVHFARRIIEEQPQSVDGVWNRLDYRPLDGFVLAVSPFNFTSIAGNLCTAPALMGNTVVWKAATTSVLSAQVIMDILLEAGLPKGVVNLVHAPGSMVGKSALSHPDLAGVHFTGSTATFQHMWSQVGQNIKNYRTYPRLVGETGGKDFIFAHPSADLSALTPAIIRGGFEYQGQKCSAPSRLYIPASLWPELQDRLEAEISQIKMGDITDFQNFMGAVIDQNSFNHIKGYLDRVSSGSGAKVVIGGKCDDSTGFFIEPTLVLAEDPKHELMSEELFGPVVTAYVYPDDKIPEALTLCDTTSPYALTGAVFSQDRYAASEIMQRLRFAAGNFYINDKPTGAVVGQQPFGGGRASGTNDKAGSPLNLQRWTSPRTVKETMVPSTRWDYPFMS